VNPGPAEGPESAEGAEPAESAGPAGKAGAADPAPLRVTTLELFFDLVFAFILTQLTALLTAPDHVAAGILQVLLIFGLLWWMYGAYAWLTNARPPVHTAERLLLLVAMAGFLTVGLAIPDGFGRSGLALGLGYLTVVLVHGLLYYRVNRNIIRVAPFNIGSALLVTIAGLLTQSSGRAGPAGYALWIAALAVQLGSPLVVHPKGLFDLRPAHFVERHSALIIVALGESVAAIGIGAARLAGHAGQLSARLLTAALLGLALAAALWWIVFGDGDEDQAERVLTAQTSERRTALALSAYFYGNIPLLLGIVAVAAGVQQAIEYSARLTPGPVIASAVLAAGAALFLAGDAAFRRLLRTGQVRLRIAAAALALATTAAGAAVALEVQLALLTAILVATLVLERRYPGAGQAGHGRTGTGRAGTGQAGSGPAAGTLRQDRARDR
jgi:low temperature requirement protein LtrA